MKAKLIYLDNHFYVIDDGEIKEGDFWYCNITKTITNAFSTEKTLKGLPHKDAKIITHSTQQLDNVILLNKSEIEELVFGYSVDKLAEKEFSILDMFKTGYLSERTKWYRGFKAAMELKKDKLFTIEDMRKAIFESHSVKANIENIIQSLLPKTEWDIEIESEEDVRSPMYGSNLEEYKKYKITLI